MKVLVIGLAVAAALVPMPPAAVERLYATSLYLEIQSRLTRASNLAPFALLDLLATLVVVVWLGAIVRDIVRRVGWRRGAGRCALRTAALVGALYLAFLALWGINYRPPSCTPRRGTYALQAVEVHRPRHIEVGCLDWLTVEPPDERIGHSIYIYQVNKERLDRLVANRGRERPFWRSGPPPSGPPGAEP